MTRTPSRREVLNLGLFATLGGIAGKAFAAPLPVPSALKRTHIRTDLEAEFLRIYRNASPVEAAAINRLLRRIVAGNDKHAAGVEFLMECGWTEANARARTAAVFGASRTGHGA